MRKSIVLLEVIISLLLFSIIALISIKMSFSLIDKNTYDTFSVRNNLLLETTKLYLNKQITLKSLRIRDSSLYFDDNLLLENISKYENRKSNNITTINICIYENKVCQTWKIRD